MKHLPLPWVDRIFEKLTLVYGSEFVNRWKSIGVPIEKVKEDWALELAGFHDQPDSIAHALQHLPPDRAPTALQFRDMCRKAPPKQSPALTYAGSPMPPEIREKLKSLTNQLRMKG